MAAMTDRDAASLEPVEGRDWADLSSSMKRRDHQERQR